MALGGIAGTGLGNLLNSLSGGGRALEVRSPRAKLRAAGPKGEKSEAAGAAGAPGGASVRVEVKAMQVRLLLEATIRVSRQSEKLNGGGGGPNLAARLAEVMAGHAEAFEPDEEGLRPIDRLAEQFTPEATAARIFDFAVSWYGQWLDGSEDSEENRAAFAEYIGAAVEKGFREAQAILGVLPGNVQADIDRTHEIVFSAFQDFIENGLSKSPGELAAARGAGLAFNYTFGAFNDPVSLMDEVLGRLNPDGSLRLEAIPVPDASGQLVDLVA